MVILDFFKELYFNYKRYIWICSLIVVILLMGYFMLNRETEVIIDNLGADTLMVATSEEDDFEEEVMIGVDIKGAVNNPGYYYLESDGRVIDAIKASGGLKETADTSVLNLSKKLVDEMVIIVYTIDEVNDFLNVLKKEEVIQEECVVNNNINNDACNDNNANNENDNNFVNINTASSEELQTLSSIGAEKAEQIIEYRNSVGLFSKIEDIMNVSGIGEAIFAKIKENITV